MVFRVMIHIFSNRKKLRFGKLEMLSGSLNLLVSRIGEGFKNPNSEIYK